MYKKLVTVLSLAALSFVAMPGNAQIVVLAGYDIDFEGLSVGGGYNIPLELTLGPIGPTMVRPSAEYVFAGGGNNFDLSVLRVAGEILGMFSLGGDSSIDFHNARQSDSGAAPFVKAGIALERFSFDYDSEFLGGSASNSEVGLTLGGGVMFGAFSVEGTIGVGNISDIRVAAGYTFNI